MGRIDGQLGPSIEVERRLRPSIAAAAEARRVIDELRGIEDETRECVRLLVSELVTNAVRHGGIEDDGEIAILCRLDQGFIRVEVAQPSSAFGSNGRPVPTKDATSGWGLFLVDALAQRWGIDRRGNTRVWFEIDRSDPTVDRLRPATRRGRGAPR